MTDLKPKEMEVSSQGSFADGRWHFTIQAWVSSESAANALIEIIKVMKPLLAENPAPSSGDGSNG